MVVAAAGTTAATRPLLMPALDPHVIAVGAVDHEGTATSSDDRSRTSATAAPPRDARRARAGKSVVSLRVPGGYVDQCTPRAWVPVTTRPVLPRQRDVPGHGGGRRRGGAPPAGKPNLTPDQVKALLTLERDRLPLATAARRGVVDVSAALDLVNLKTLPTVLGGLLGSGRPGLPWSSGTGSLEASRGASTSSTRRPVRAGR